VLGPSSTESQVELAWAALTTATETGGASILSYNAQWDQGVGTEIYVDLVGYVSDFSETGFNITSGISPGAVFKFRVRAKNMWGWSSQYSDLLTVTPSAKPEQMAAVTTVIDSITGNVIVSWVEPEDNAATITEYSIEILQTGSVVWTEENSACDGSLEDIVEATQCSIAMSTLTADPYYLTRGDLV
jgi:hypothetical protein